MEDKMTYDICSIICDNSVKPTWPGMHEDMTVHRILWAWNRDNFKSPCHLYQEALDKSDKDILIYMHSDLDIIDPNWLKRVMDCFIDSGTAAVGLGGATSLGNLDLYRKPYNIWNLARGGYASNQVDAETHGERFTGVKKVAVLDAFFMAVRVDFLRSLGGWPVVCLTHHCLDLWLSCEVARAGKAIWMVGAGCHHHGGRASTSPLYKKAKWLQGGTLESDHGIPHKWIYENYRDVLPIGV
jgi:GT2 family glycosyltransferase